MANNYSNEGNNMSPRIEIDERYGCIRVDGVLCPDPISFALPLSSSSPPPPAQQQNRAKNRNRKLKGSDVLEWGDVHVKLLQCLDEDQTYVLELREVNNANGRAETTFHSLSPGVLKAGKRRVLTREDGSLREKVLMFPVTEEVFSDVDHTKHNLTMRQRLNGEWTYEIRERKSNEKVEKFYYHTTVSNKLIRSVNDIATFIMYGD